MTQTAAMHPESAASAPSGAALLSYIEDMLLELAHMASAGGENALAASLGIAAIQAGARLRQT